MIKQFFDLDDPKNTGRPMYFDMAHYIESVKQMICADEIQIALSMLDNVPGWYRDNYPQELTDIKNTLYQNCYDPFDYAADKDEAGFSKEFIEEQCLSEYTYPRANIVFDDIKRMNDAYEEPWVFEISPSHGWLPLGFAARGLKFDFFGKNLNQSALAKIIAWFPEGRWQSEPIAGQKKILICFEALEHMWNPHDLEQSAKKVGISFDIIYLSTPKYTLGFGLPDWNTRRLGHVRTWTPNEFTQFAMKSFPGCKWALFDSHSMVLKGEKAKSHP